MKGAFTSMRKTRRFLAILLVLIMALGIVPIHALAEYDPVVDITGTAPEIEESAEAEPEPELDRRRSKNPLQSQNRRRLRLRSRRK